MLIRRAASRAALTGALALLGSACGLFPSDPNPPVFGARPEGETIVVRIPLCATDTVRRIDVFDFDDKRETPRTVWWASDPVTPSAKWGVVTLWSGEGFAHHAGTPAAIPEHLDLGYTDPSGDGRGDYLDLPAIRKATLRTGEYWTSDGTRTAEQIDAQLGCHGGK
ncbi:hypothetical protein [Streptomyces sp. NPDC049915]|uniref:hypothetical protein n=1 Tax=Streptomyces sp. NPDC049915 TaxID=3155510 RepID=UPI003443BD2E